MSAEPQYAKAIEWLDVPGEHQDTARDPGAHLAEHLMLYYARGHVTSFVDSFAAPQVLLTALLGLVSVRDQGMTEGRLRRFEEMAKSQRLFHSED